MATVTETIVQTPPSSPRLTPPSPKPTPTRKGTLNFGLRRKASNISLTPSVDDSTKGRDSIDADENASDNANGRTSPENRSRPLKPKRMFSLLARTSKNAMASVDGAINGTHSLEPSEMSEGSENGASTQTDVKSSGGLTSSLFSSRRGSGGKAVEALSQEKKLLEEQVENLKLEKSALESAFDDEKKENQRLTSEALKRAQEWDGEKEKLKEEVGAQLVEKDNEVKALTVTVAELREELERTKESEKQLIAFKESAASELGAKLAEQEQRVRKAVGEEQETLKVKLAQAEIASEAKDEKIKSLETQVVELQEQAKTVEEELKKLKEEKQRLADGKRTNGTCSIM